MTIAMYPTHAGCHMPPTAHVSDRRIRFALVGCGRIAHNHFNAMSQHADRCELVDVCDIKPDALSHQGPRPYIVAANVGTHKRRLCDPNHAQRATPIANDYDRTIGFARDDGKTNGHAVARWSGNG